MQMLRGKRVCFYILELGEHTRYEGEVREVVGEVIHLTDVTTTVDKVDKGWCLVDDDASEMVFHLASVGPLMICK